MKTSLIPHCAPPARHQSGAALIVALLLLLVLTILGVAASRGSLTEERMTGNTQDANVAFQAAEAALREGEQFVQQPTLPYFEGASGLYKPAPPTAPPLWDTVNWNSEEVRHYMGMSGAPGNLARANADFFIEELPTVIGPGESLAADAPVDDPKHYRITARGVGAGGSAATTLQSTYKR